MYFCWEISAFYLNCNLLFIHYLYSSVFVHTHTLFVTVLLSKSLRNIFFTLYNLPRLSFCKFLTCKSNLKRFFNPLSQMVCYLEIKLADERNETNFWRLSAVQHGILGDGVPLESWKQSENQKIKKIFHKVCITFISIWCIGIISKDKFGKQTNNNNWNQRNS